MFEMLLYVLIFGIAVETLAGWMEFEMNRKKVTR